MGKLVLIMGGARSGKSRFAQDLATALGGVDVLFVATSEVRDDEMQRRVERHRQQRPAAWGLLESPQQVAASLRHAQSAASVVLVDCLTLLVSNLMLSQGDELAEEAVQEEVECLTRQARRRLGTMIIVSGEVGQGIVPNTPLGRQFRDVLGRANQQLAARADAVYQLVAGLAVEVKSAAVSAQQAARALRSPALDQACETIGVADE